MVLQDEQALILALQQEQAYAYRIFIRNYQNQIYQVCMRMMHNPSEAEDMTQETFIRVVRSIKNFQGDCSLKTWVYRIAINLCKNRILYLQRRHQNKHQAISSIEGDQWQYRSQQGHTIASLSPQASIISPDQSLLQKEIRAHMDQALKQVDTTLRELLILRDIQGLSYQEICDITDLALGTVKSRLHRARLLFIQYYQELQNPPQKTKQHRESKAKSEYQSKIKESDDED
jgi:RNA polymerase sigma-70 factor, ECF subfamily